METNQKKEEENVEQVIEKLKDKKEFAREQYEFLKSKGITNRVRLSRIFKSCGPGQIQEAFKLADCVDWRISDDGESNPDKDALECLLAGAMSVRWGWKRMAAVLDDSDFYVPEAHNSKCFFRIIAGAREILSPGSHKFTKKQMEEIKEGLKKKVYEGDEEVNE